MAEKKKQRKMLLDEESWAWWYELDKLEDTVDPWCCRLIREGNFEEEALKTMNELFGSCVQHLRVHFCIHCGNSLNHDAELRNYPDDCCCRFSSLFEFAEIFDPRTADVHRLKGNFCFNCGKGIKKTRSPN